ncbi:Coiled-coil and C2 domain-containing 2B [Apodemus speciosus]|uniref:Coiled-coil and C2 domain-containing 2B n=1 Tax=Apodemus speciosus TaxID=105296 RepID=A0ABQ0FT41_APOSI
MNFKTEENRNITETLRGKVREKLKNAKISQGEKPSAEPLTDTKTCRWSKNLSLQHRRLKEDLFMNESVTKNMPPNTVGLGCTEVLLDEGLSFFILSGEDDSAVSRSSQQASFQNAAESQDEDFMEEVILTDLFEVKAAEYDDDQERIKKQEANIFVPSSSPVASQQKLPKGMLPRILEDEGLYTQKKPETYKKICNKMENRLLSLQEGKCWFEESGEIMSLPSPIRQSWNFRLCMSKESLNPALKTIHRKSRGQVTSILTDKVLIWTLSWPLYRGQGLNRYVKSDVGCCFRNRMDGQREMYQLDLNIVGLQFSHHPLFNQEQVLCARLLQLCESFQDRQKQSLSQLLYEKAIVACCAGTVLEYQFWEAERGLRALKDATKLASQNPEASQFTRKSLQDYYRQISDTKQLYDAEREKDHSLLHSVLQTWKQIKSLRQKQGFTSTPVKLQFHRIKMNSWDEQGQVGVSEGPGEESEETPFQNEDTQESYEQKRRAKMQKLKYFIKIFYNDKQVSRTSVSPLQFDFKVMFQQIFNIQLIYWPETICLEGYEISKRPTLLVKLYLPLPNKTELKGKTVLEYTEFSSDKLVIPMDGGVGSIGGTHQFDVPFNLEESENEELCLLTSGKLSYSLSWALDENGIPLTPVSQSLSSAYCSVLRNVDARGVPGLPWIVNSQKLCDWADDVRIDPNNPEYSDITELIMYLRHKGQEIPKYFRLEQLQDEFNFVSEEEMKRSKRFQLLQLRNAGQLDLFLLQQMPLYDSEIPDVVLQEYESQAQKDVSISDVNSITAQRINSINFLKKVRRLIMKRIVKVSKFNLSDIVADYEEIVSTSQLTDAICKFIEPRRKLKPQRKERRKVTAQSVSDGDIKILVRILRAYNIPTRKTVSYRTLIINEDTVHPFIEVSFQHTVYQTNIANGSHPCWNEEIKVDFISPGHDYSFSSLSKIKDNIHINIFDEVVIEKHEDHCLKSCSAHSYIQKNWLGSISFPFSALLQQPEISGTFQVNLPPILLGYTWSSTYVPPREDCSGQNPKECTFLNIFATIEPQISYVTYNPKVDEFSDQIDVLQRAQTFTRNCKAMFPNRRVMATVFNGEGMHILVTRYIKALNPPQQLLDIFLHDSNATLTPEVCSGRDAAYKVLCWTVSMLGEHQLISFQDLIARFVSLIPFAPETLDENDASDIWMTSECCISLAIGNKEEHAILLCNFFLYFGKKALVILGTSVLEGHVAYVLTQETGECLLWDPSTGQCHKQFDPFCPLQSVDCLFNDKNVWFNIQQNNTPMAVQFDYSKESFWKQLLPKNFQGTKAQSVQPEEIVYSDTNKSMVEDLKSRIERALKCKMMEWRPKHPTRWNRQCTSVLRQILPKLEFYTGSFASFEDSELERLLQFYWDLGLI